MEKLKNKKNVAWIVCLISFILVFVSGAIMQMSWYPHQTLQGWPAIISTVICFCSLIVAINQTDNYLKAKRVASTALPNQRAQQSISTQKNNSTNSVVSLICAIIPLLLLLITFFSSASSKSSGANQSGLLFFIYICTIGIPLLLVWLICGILGLKSEKKTMAIISLIIGPICFILTLLFFLTAH